MSADFITREAEESDLTTLFKPAKKTAWQKMNRIQKGGAILFLILAVPACGRSETALTCGVAGWTALYLGYVIGYLYHRRHAIHFWWSSLAACTVHCLIIPAYVSLISWLNTQPRMSGRAYVTPLSLMLIAEVLISIFVLKQVAVWQQRRRINSWGRL